jgi:hypothetical protein
MYAFVMSTLKWIKPEVQKKIAALEGRYPIRYRYDWSPCTKPHF